MQHRERYDWLLSDLDMNRSKVFSVLNNSTPEQRRSVFYVFGSIRDRLKLCTRVEAIFIFESIVFSMEVKHSGEVFFIDIRDEGSVMVSMKSNHANVFYSSEYEGPAQATQHLLRDLK